MKDQRETPIIVVRKKGRSHAHHGGAWKVAFADFMTAMMAMFLVLWIVSQSTEIRSAVAGYFKDPLGRGSEFGNSFIPGTGAQSASVRIIDQSQLIEVRRDRLNQLGVRIREQIQQQFDLKALENHVSVNMVEEGLRIDLMENERGVFFELGSPQPSAAGAEILTLLAEEFAGMPNPIVIEGHTDARQYGEGRDYTNWELSTDRANMARRILTSGGLPAERVYQIRGHADRDLRVHADPYSPRNRRVSITLLLQYNLAARDPANSTSGTVP